jgi:hypothetical protein
MSSANVLYLQSRRQHVQDSGPRDARVIQAFSAALSRCPPKPAGLAACVAWLQQSPAEISGKLMAVRTLQSLRDGLFVAPGREAEIGLLWREAVATACYARVLAAETGNDAALLTGVGLLHRAGEIAAVRALAHAEKSTGQRLAGPVMGEIFDADDDELASRVTRSWGLPGGMRLAIIRWREEQDSINRPESVSLLMMAQALTTELVHAANFTPGLVEAASEALKVPGRMIAAARSATDGLARLLSVLAPQPV